MERLQLMLPFPRQADYDARDFVAAASNAAAMTWLDRLADWPDRRLALWGPSGCGKTHLGAVWTERTGGVMLSAPGLSDLDGVPEHGGLVLDNADLVPEDRILLHLLNTARDRGLSVLLLARTAPARWDVPLRDLSSRLRAITSVEIEPPDDELLRVLLIRLLADRQLAVPPPVQTWILRHVPRSAAALQSAVARLDRVSMATGRSITRPLAAMVLESDESSMAPPEVHSQPAGLL